MNLQANISDMLEGLLPLQQEELNDAQLGLNHLLELPIDILEKQCHGDSSVWLQVLADAIHRLIHHFNSLATHAGESWRWEALLQCLQTLSVLRYAGDGNLAIRQSMRQIFFIKHLTQFLQQSTASTSSCQRLPNLCLGAASTLLALCYATEDEVGNKLEEIDLLALPLECLPADASIQLLGRCRLRSLNHLDACRLHRMLRRTTSLSDNDDEAVALTNNMHKIAQQLKQHGQTCFSHL
jgi:hypothetical protein